jgi:hypothetical protein
MERFSSLKRDRRINLEAIDANRHGLCPFERSGKSKNKFHFDSGNNAIKELKVTSAHSIPND